jgi:hypothetical protein
MIKNIIKIVSAQIEFRTGNAIFRNGIDIPFGLAITVIILGMRKYDTRY